MSHLKKAIAPGTAALEDLLRDCAVRIERAIRDEVATRLDEAVSRALSLRPAEAPARGDAVSAKPRRMCPVPGCPLPAAGPKYAWRCRDHKLVSRLEIDRLREDASAPTITRLPPGPNPDRPRRTGPSMDCRMPGCLTRSRGPRYDFFCGDHYKILSPEERKSYAAQWKAARVAGVTAPRVAESTVRIRRGLDVRAAEIRSDSAAVATPLNPLDPKLA